MNTVFHLTATQLALAIGVFVPALVALVTKDVAPGWLKQLVLLLLAAVGGWFATASSSTPYNLKTVLISIGVVFITSAASYFNLDQFLWKPVVKQPTANFGIGAGPRGGTA